MRNFLFAFVLLLASCSDSPTENQNDSTGVDSVAVMRDTTLRRPQSVILDTVPTKSAELYSRMDPAAISDAMVKYTPEGWVIMDTMTGDLNRDAFTDLLIVLQRENESESDSDFVRPILIFTGNTGGGLDFRERNDSVTLCYRCGGVYGDPYDGLAIKNGYFSVQHYGGSSWRWTKIITFRYNESQKTWLLHRDAGVSYNVFEPEKEEPEIVSNQEHYGKMKFVEYTSM
jgi:hypothetical protein